jgi:arylsulfatase A-like enzyme
MYPILRRVLSVATIIFAVAATICLPACVGASPAPSEPVTPAKTRPPNIIFILIDDLGWSDLGCYGSTFHETPNLDGLAKAGVRFTQAYAAAPLCSPTRAAILTGKHPARLHLTTYLPGRADSPAQKLLHPKINQHLPLEEVTLAEALKEKGYRCGHFGKWHLGGTGFLPEDQGFDVNVGGTAGGSPPRGYFAFQTPTLKPTEEGEYLTDRLTDEAERFIDDNHDRPFFLYLCHFAVHIPLQGKPGLVKKYEAKAKRGQGLGQGQNNPTYAAMLESVDESVGRIVRKLDSVGLSENTILVFTSDNGGLAVKEGANTPATCNAPLRGAKGQLFEGGIRVPLIVRMPGTIPAGGVCDVPVTSTDFYPTFLAACGAANPATTEPDGVNILPLLTGTGEVPKRDALFWHQPHYTNQGGTPGGAVRKGDFKLIEFYEDERVELYRLPDDAGENRDLSREMPEKRNELRKLLHDWRASVDAQMPAPNPKYDPDWKEPPSVEERARDAARDALRRVREESRKREVGPRQEDAPRKRGN